MRAYERFIKYVKVNTRSDDKSNTFPSTLVQVDFAKTLNEELLALGINSQIDEMGYIYASIPATKGYENAKTIGFIAHVDTAPDFSGEGVNPILHKNYDGKDIVLPKDNRTISPEKFPALKTMVGKTVITADGSTLLGADDKAGIAEIITACDEIIKQNIPHGNIKIAFTPDEEIGAGADKFDVEKLGADFAYTMDGDLVGGIEYENFNAASAVIEVTGVAVHTGSAKGIMVNALLLINEIINMLPNNQIPSLTENYEGFYHIDDIQGNSSNAKLELIIRDHDKQLFNDKKQLLMDICNEVQTKYPTASVNANIKDTYYNMMEKIEPCMHLIHNARLAIEQANIVPFTNPIRGGTDGARLSYMGLPCPNLGTGGTNFHGPYELINIEDMDTAVEIIKNIIKIYAEQ